MNKLQIDYINIKDIKPYDKNARRHQEADVEAIKKSIEHFGMCDPIGIWGKDNTIVEGHGRVLALRKLGYKQVPIIRLDHLTDEERRAYTLAHNRTAELSNWDMDIVNVEISDISIDMSDFGFEIDTVDADPIESKKQFDLQEAIFRATNYTYYDHTTAEGIYGMPMLEPIDHVPDHMIGFNYAKTSKDFDACIHFYLDDYQFERIWVSPKKYINLLKKFDSCLTPNFSIYMDMPEAIKIWNTFRSRLLGQILQNNGLKVIPIVYWSTPESYEYCFDGIPKDSTVSINNIIDKNEYSRKLWNDGVDELIKRKHPKRILLYGNGVKCDYDFGDIEVVCYKNSVTERMSKSKE